MSSNPTQVKTIELLVLSMANLAVGESVEPQFVNVGPCKLEQVPEGREIIIS